MTLFFDKNLIISTLSLTGNTKVTVEQRWEIFKIYFQNCESAEPN